MYASRIRAAAASYEVLRIVLRKLEPVVDIDGSLADGGGGGGAGRRRPTLRSRHTDRAKGLEK